MKGIISTPPEHEGHGKEHERNDETEEVAEDRHSNLSSTSTTKNSLYCSIKWQYYERSWQICKSSCYASPWISFQGRPALAKAIGAPPWVRVGRGTSVRGVTTVGVSRPNTIRASLRVVMARPPILAPTTNTNDIINEVPNYRARDASTTVEFLGHRVISSRGLSEPKLTGRKRGELTLQKYVPEVFSQVVRRHSRFGAPQLPPIRRRYWTAS